MHLLMYYSSKHSNVITLSKIKQVSIYLSKCPNTSLRGNESAETCLYREIDIQMIRRRQKLIFHGLPDYKTYFAVLNYQTERKRNRNVETYKSDCQNSEQKFIKNKISKPILKKNEVTIVSRVFYRKEDSELF